LALNGILFIIFIIIIIIIIKKTNLTCRKRASRTGYKVNGNSTRNCYYYYYTVSQKKTSHFNFCHNFAICWDIFTIFEAFCSGI